MASGNGRRSIDQEIDYVRECIERCMQMYMNKRETLNFLSTQGNIQPGITRIVWARLERDNPEFFRAYYVRLALLDQITKFNRLLRIQAELKHQTGLLAGNAKASSSTTSHATQRISMPNTVQGSMYPETENMEHIYAFNNNGASTHACMQGTYNHSLLPPDMFLSQNSNVVLTQSVNEMIGYGGRQELSFAEHSSLMEPNPPMGDAYMSNFSNINNLQHFDDILLNYRILGQHQQNCATDYPVDSSSSSGFSLYSNTQNLDDLVSRYGVWEQYQTTSTPEYPIESSSSTGNVEMMDPGSSRSLRNPYFE